MLQHKLTQRLLENYDTYGNLCVAFDYDNTLFPYSTAYSQRCRECLDLAVQAQDLGLDIVIWTCSPTSRFMEITKYLKENGLHTYLINEVKEVYNIHQEHTIKPFFSILLDGRVGLTETKQVLSDVLDYVRFSKE